MMSIKDFPLAWRWTSKAHAELPPEILETLHPLQPKDAEALLQRLPKSLGPDAIKHQANEPPHETRKWLERLPVKTSEATLVWDKKTALTVPWSTFISYWNAFCYPSSDDTAIILGANQGLLLWHHYEMFEFMAGAL